MTDYPFHESTKTIADKELTFAERLEAQLNEDDQTKELNMIEYVHNEK